jgi:large subunit ribosomal protein L18
MALSKLERRERIKNRIRKRLSGTGDVPRMSVFRSNKHISVQIINDDTGDTLVSASSLNKEIASAKDINKVQQAGLVGKLIAEKALKANISEVVFDRGGYLYHGRVKSLADAAREAGLKF